MKFLTVGALAGEIEIGVLVSISDTSAVRRVQ